MPNEKRSSGRLHGVQHVGVTVSHFEDAVQWYHRMFGFYLVSEVHLPPEQTSVELYGREGLSVRLGFLATQSGAVVEIFEFTPADPAEPVVWNRPGFSHLAISVSNVEAVKAGLEAQGVEFVTDVRFTNGAHWAFLKDPDGNLIELIDFHANRLPLKWAGRLVGRFLRRGKFLHYYR